MQLFILLAVLPTMLRTSIASDSQPKICSFETIILQGCDHREKEGDIFYTCMTFGPKGVTGPDGQTMPGEGILPPDSSLCTGLQSTGLQSGTELLDQIQSFEPLESGKELHVSYKLDGETDGTSNFRYDSCAWNEPNSKKEGGKGCNEAAYCNRGDWTSETVVCHDYSDNTPKRVSARVWKMEEC
jgi:hypothetical protein